MTAAQVGDHEHFGAMHYSPHVRANVLSGKYLHDSFNTSLHRWGYRVETSDGTVYNFKKRRKLYVCNVDEDVEVPRENHW